MSYVSTKFEGVSWARRGMEEFSHEFFEQASKAWLKNKIRRGHQYVYKCEVEGCKRQSKKDSVFCARCGDKGSQVPQYRVQVASVGPRVSAEVPRVAYVLRGRSVPLLA